MRTLVILAVAVLICSRAAAETTRERCSGTSGYNAICGCSVEVSNAVEGLPVDVSILGDDRGPDDVIRIFTSGGSLNIPVMCRAGLYLVDDDPRWFEEYFELQADPAQPGLMGSEIMSPLYGPPVVGAVIAVLAHARERGDASLVDQATAWLRAYWALNALVAEDGPIRDATFVLKTSVVNSDGYAGFDGVSAGMAGMRADKSGQIGPGSLVHPLLTTAIARSPRRYDAGLGNSPGYYYGLRIALLVAGYTLDGNGKVDLAAMTPPAAAFGLTDGERDLLRRFIAGRGAAELDDVLAMVGPFRSSCTMTLLRTSEGVASWFGTDTEAQRFCNRNKGPYSAVTVTSAATAEYLHPTLATFPAEGGRSYRDGDRLCAELDDGTVRCIDLIGGDIVYQIEWTMTGGIAVVVDNTAHPLPDAGPDPIADAGPEPPDAAEPGAGADGGVLADDLVSGCGCRTGGSGPAPPIALAVAALALSARRRSSGSRRRSRRARP